LSFPQGGLRPVALAPPGGPPIKAAAYRNVEARSLADRTGPLGRNYILLN